MTAELPDVRSLLAEWGLPATAALTRPGRGTNNHTVIVTDGDRRFVLRISQNLTDDQVRAEHRLLARLRQAGLPFAVPEPLPALGGESLVPASAGPATLTAWLPGVRPELTDTAAMARLGRTAGLLSRALAAIPPQDAPHNWVTAAHVHPDVPDAGELCRDLIAAGADPALVALLERQAAAGQEPAASLPVQVVHGDLAASNLLAAGPGGAITAVLDFEIAGLSARIQELAVTLSQSGALERPDWRQQAGALAAGYSSAAGLTGAEIAALPGLLAGRAVGTVLWRAGRWRLGQAQLPEVTARLEELGRTVSWLAACGGELADLIAAQSSAPGGVPPAV